MFFVRISGPLHQETTEVIPIRTAMKVANAWAALGEKVVSIHSADGAESWSPREFAEGRL